MADPTASVAKAVPPAVIPRVLLALTFVTGMVDAVSYLGLGRTFVANMTGNVVLLGFGLAGAGGLAVAPSLTALAAFVAGAAAGGRVVRRMHGPRHRWLLPAIAVETALAGVAALVAIGLHAGEDDGRRYAVIAVLAVAMGVRNAIVRAVGVPDLTTTVLTMTITGLAADSPAGGGSGAGSARRASAVAAMLLGAVAGALLVEDHDLALPLAVVCALSAAALVACAAGVRAAEPA
jgi:uncharacterized membrane protein YoaK (UPF0700 family)